MQTNIKCGLPGKGKFLYQQLRVLLEIPDLLQRLAPRPKFHALANPPTGVYCGLAARACWLPLLLPVDPLLLGPASGLPRHLLHCLSMSTSPSMPFYLFFLYNKTFWCGLHACHFEKISGAQAAGWLLC